MSSIYLIKEEIKEIRNTYNKKNKEEVYRLIKELREKIECFYSKSETILKKVYYSYSKHRKNLTKFANDEFVSREEGVNYLFISGDDLDNVLKDSEKHSSELKEILTQVDNLYKKLQKARAKLENDYYKLRKEVPNRIKSLEGLTKKLETLRNQDCKQTNEDFEFLKKPMMMKDAYEKSLTEISRRKWFFETFYPIFEELKNNFISENNLRMKFHQCYGDILPEKFVPELKNLLPDFSEMTNFKKDKNLPEIKGYHSSEDIKLTVTPEQIKAQSPVLGKGICALKEEIDKLSKKLKTKDEEVSKAQKENINLIENLTSANEKLTAYNKLREDLEQIDYSEFKMITRHSTLKESRVRSLIKSILSSQARSIYDYFSPMVTSKNQEVADSKIRVLQMKTEYDKILQDKEKEYNKKISEFHRDMEEMHLRLTKQRKLNEERESEMNYLKEMIHANEYELKGLIKEKDEEIDQLTKSLNSIKKELEFKEQENFNLELKIQDIEEENKQSQKNKNRDYNKDRNEFEDEETAEVGIQLSFELEKKEEIIKNQKIELERLRKFLKQSKKEVEELKEERKAAQSQTQNMKEELNKVRRDLESTKNAGNFNIPRPSNRSSGDMLSPMKERYSSQQLSSSQGEENLRRRLNDCEDELKQQESKYNNMKNLLNCADDDVKRLKEKLKARDDQYYQMNAQIETYEQQIASFEENAERLDQEYQRQISDKERVIQELKKKLKDLEDRKISIEEKNEELENLVREEKEKQENLKNELKRNKEEFKQKIDIEKKNIKKKLEDEKNNLENQINGFKKDKEELEKEKIELNNQINIYNNEKSDLKYNLEKYKKKLTFFIENKIRFDKLQVGYLCIFYKAHSRFYVPLIDDVINEDSKIGYINSEKDIEEFIKNLDNGAKDDQVRSLTFSAVLETKELSNKNFDLAPIFVARVDSIFSEKVDLYNNRNLVSFTEKDTIWKIKIEEPMILWNYQS